MASAEMQQILAAMNLQSEKTDKQSSDMMALLLKQNEDSAKRFDTHSKLFDTVTEKMELTDKAVALAQDAALAAKASAEANYKNLASRFEAMDLRLKQVESCDDASNTNVGSASSSWSQNGSSGWSRSTRFKGSDGQASSRTYKSHERSAAHLGSIHKNLGKPADAAPGNNRPNCLRLVGFEWEMIRDDIIEAAKPIVLPILPENMRDTVKFHAGALAKSVVVEFLNSNDAQLVFENNTETPMVYHESPSDPQAFLRFKFDSPPEIRVMGTRLSKLWALVHPRLTALAGQNPWNLKADRARGRLLLHVGKRVICLFSIVVSDDVDAPLGVSYKNPLPGLPSWFPMENIVDISNSLNDDAEM